LKEKRSGVFDCHLAMSHPLTEHFPEPLWVPHSRYNDLPEPALAAAGYKILTRSATAGVDTFAKQDGSFFLFFQGHPEYDADTLLREYRRDATRFLTGERPHYPNIPVGYFTAEARAIAEAFAARARQERHSDLMTSFPKSALDAGFKQPWHAAAVGVYQKWVAYLLARKVERPANLALRQPLRRTWRDWPASLRRSAQNPAG
jgi:homoserine O-succinyltransferase